MAAMFLAHVEVRLSPPSDAATLNGLLARVWESARTRWPAVKLAPELFMRHLAERLPSPEPKSSLESLLAQLAVEELYLACACLHHVPLALETFEQHYLRKLPKLLRSRERSAADLDEICQVTRVKLLVSSSEGPPKIAEYKGNGALLSWVRVTAMRIAAKQTRKDKPTVNPDEEIIQPLLSGTGNDPELDRIKQHHHEDLRHAMREAFASLSDADRYLLRLYYVDRISMYDLGPLLGISQPTVSRRLEQVREKIRKETQRHLEEHLKLSPRDFQSFIKLLDSQFDLRISQVLGGAAALVRPPASR
jgi:RNA polymerase sigma-70 factor (ECF subfamily)